MLWHGSDLNDLPTDSIGYVQFENKKVTAHRAIYAAHNNLSLREIASCVIGRTCGNVRCCAPEHLCVRGRISSSKETYEEATPEILALALQIEGSIIEVASIFNIHPYEVYRLRAGDRDPGKVPHGKVATGTSSA